MADFTPQPITINPLWVTLAMPALRWLVTVLGASSAAVDVDLTTKVLKAGVTIVMLGWSVYSWWRTHQKAKVLNASPPGSAVVK
jgi:dipeptide/tripeptide permease